ncbi:MAG: glutathione S-transferase [Hyphomonas sp.]|uniref:glutathione S-transferase family protein n=1 Tax=Hyphomonas sp. TaxID=87 RepID=UPI0017B36AEB|nr:glutathione S-transferase [Hyphomonas sp.]MBU3922004.1 glutathione S-transferase [Alphaproteobacteria bacterium]MBA3069446.1 glutathione S-transferase [Hyphomonas sp.]MBU4063828.1 glutathione S-transferase [Alphaproteobacteria bacterium]MBU4164211.1 glutathione S-transferase [Alphaproteobacteria bacterium]MBU4567712.1 glutathione S-transferase [Alphaproteobacteria bacterium]
MITLHHLEKSQSIRILWLLEELGAPYEIKLYDRDPKTRLAPAAYKAVSPLGTAPVITDGDVTLAETNAIIDYILDQYGNGRLRPAAGTPERAPYLFWFHTAQGSLQPLLTNKFVMMAMTTRAPFLVRPVAKSLVAALDAGFFGPRLNALMGEIEKALGKHKWFAGDELTAADIVMGYSMELCAHRAGMDEKRFPNGHRFLKQMREYPSYIRAMEKDGKGTILL